MLADEIPDLRKRMVDDQIAARGIADPAVLAAMREVPRDAFVPDAYRIDAYEDSPLPIGAGQTISQPYIVALMLEAARLRPTDRVLEVGSGSGYATAVASRIVARVYAIERVASLCERARGQLEALGYGDKIELRCGDGSIGWPEVAPFDAIIVSAGAPALPDALRRQLVDGGRMVLPIGDDPHGQDLVRVTRRTESRFEQETLCAVRFVPLIGAEAWPDAGDRESALPQPGTEAPESDTDDPGANAEADPRRPRSPTGYG
jgi:protein-L-isoaspartate(D-aspartate) O-methyltransferase